MAAARHRSAPGSPPPAASTAARPAVPRDTRVYAVGDIHGRCDLLVALQEQIRAHALEQAIGRRVLVYLGDYIDRGTESRAVLDRLLGKALPGFETVPLLGNHEDSLMRFLDDTSVGPAWLYYGGIQTLASYGIAAEYADLHDESRLRALQEALRRCLPRSHLSFLRRMPLQHREGDYLFVHAGIRPQVALENQGREDLLWIRDEFLDSPVDHGVTVVHGHTISPVPELLPNRIGIDTGAYASGRLTCLVLEGDGRSFLST